MFLHCRQTSLLSRYLLWRNHRCTSQTLRRKLSSALLCIESSNSLLWLNLRRSIGRQVASRWATSNSTILSSCLRESHQRNIRRILSNQIMLGTVASTDHNTTRKWRSKLDRSIHAWRKASFSSRSMLFEGRPSLELLSHRRALKTSSIATDTNWIARLWFHWASRLVWHLRQDLYARV